MALNKWDKQHLLNLGLTQKQIDKIFDTAVKEAAAIGVSLHDFNIDKPFSFSDYPQTKARIDKLLKSLQNNIEKIIVNGVRSEWTLANNKNNVLCDFVFGDNKYKLTKEQERKYYSNNDKALEAFTQRKTNGLKLSSRVWNYTEQFKDEIETGLDLGIRNGLPAAEMARELKQYLREPYRLFRRVMDEHGQLHLSRAAKKYHPGTGVYRSSYKNAMRLARTENNMAYRTSDHERWQQLDFVVGIEIRLSNNHTLNGKPFTDICDELQGKYPKDFKFTGWHPQCRCHAISILKTPEELAKDNERILNGEEPGNESVNSVKDIPDNFKKWVAENADRIEKANSNGTLPYFLTDNQKMIFETPQKRIKTEEQKADIQKRWDERKKLNAEYEMLGELIPDVRTWAKDFSLEELRGVFAATKKTMSKFDGFSLEDKIEKLKFELKYSIEHAKYKTTPIANEIYKKQITKAEYLLAKQNVETSISGALEFAKTTRSVKVKQMAAELTELLNGETPIATLQAKARALNAEAAGLEAERLKRKFKKIGVDISSTLEDYEKQNIPTLKNARKLIEDYIKRKEGSPELYEPENAEKMKKIMSELFDNSDFGMYIGGYQNNVEVLNKILDSYFKSQMETGTGGGLVNKAYRQKASKNLFGTDIKKTQDKDYEKYGFLMDRDIIKQSKSGTAKQYGKIAVRFKKDKVIATFTMGDSLGSGLNPSLTTDPKVSSFGERVALFNDLSGALKRTKSAVDFTDKYAGYRSYVELQYHGHLGTDAIESIFIPKQFVSQLDMKILNKYRGKIKFYTEENGKLKTLL
ncbi:MAG: hypothetical protein FWF53_03330 [Candidatus Azobacteroides sp.]|nr:hypothetical protein [Candidatus Azobacteroides sp.]